MSWPAYLHHHNLRPLPCRKMAQPPEASPPSLAQRRKSITDATSYSLQRFSEAYTEQLETLHQLRSESRRLEDSLTHASVHPARAKRVVWKLLIPCLVAIFSGLIYVAQNNPLAETKVTKETTTPSDVYDPLQAVCDLITCILLGLALLLGDSLATTIKRNPSLLMSQRDFLFIFLLTVGGTLATTLWKIKHPLLSVFLTIMIALSTLFSDTISYSSKFNIDTWYVKPTRNQVNQCDPASEPSTIERAGNTPLRRQRGPEAVPSSRHPPLDNEIRQRSGGDGKE